VNCVVLHDYKWCFYSIELIDDLNFTPIITIF
jgi:hypothetical protein